MALSTTTVRISVHTRDQLRRLAERRGVSTAALLEELAEREEEEDEVSSWARDLNELPNAQLQAYRDELVDWAAVTDDGLSDIA